MKKIRGNALCRERERERERFWKCTHSSRNIKLFFGILLSSNVPTYIISVCGVLEAKVPNDHFVGFKLNRITCP